MTTPPSHFQHFHSPTRNCSKAAQDEATAAFSASLSNPSTLTHLHYPTNLHLKLFTMTGATAGSRVADILHKTVTTGLIVITIAGVADVVRGFGVLTKRNIDRRAAGGDAAGAPSAGASSREE